MLERMKLVAPSRSAMAKRDALDAWTVYEPFDPGVDWYIKVDTSCVDKKRDFPNSDGAN